MRPSNLKFKEAGIVHGKIVIEGKVEGLDDIVVSASKFQQSKRDILQKIVNINARSIALINPQTSAHVLETIQNSKFQIPHSNSGQTDTRQPRTDNG